MERYNPHPSLDPEYDVEIVETEDGLARVRYVRHPEVEWNVYEVAVRSWLVRSGEQEREEEARVR